MTYGQTHDIPIGELLDLITIDQIKSGALKLREYESDDEIIPDVR